MTEELETIKDKLENAGIKYKYEININKGKFFIKENVMKNIIISLGEFKFQKLLVDKKKDGIKIKVLTKPHLTKNGYLRAKLQVKKIKFYVFYNPEKNTWHISDNANNWFWLKEISSFRYQFFSKYIMKLGYRYRFIKHYILYSLYPDKYSYYKYTHKKK